MRVTDIKTAINNKAIATRIEQFLIGSKYANISDNSGTVCEAWEVEVGKNIVVSFAACRKTPDDVTIRVYNYKYTTDPDPVECNSVSEARKYIWNVEYEISMEGRKPFKGYIHLHKDFTLDIENSKTGRMVNCGKCLQYARDVLSDTPIWIFNMATDPGELEIITATMQ